MGAFRKKNGMHPFFLSEPYETVSDQESTYFL